MTRVLAVLAIATCALQAQTPSVRQLQTVPERTDYRETSRYEDVVAFVRAVDAASPRIHVTTFGYTVEGRALPLAVVGDVPNASPDAQLWDNGCRDQPINPIRRTSRLPIN